MVYQTATAKIFETSCMIEKTTSLRSPSVDDMFVSIITVECWKCFAVNQVAPVPVTLLQYVQCTVPIGSRSLAVRAEHPPSHG